MRIKDEGDKESDLQAERSSLARALAYMDEYYDQPLNIRQLAQLAHFSPYHFIRIFRKTYQETPHQYVIRKRIERAKELLACGEESVTEICFAVGFESITSFSALFRKMVGWSPSVYRARAWEMRRHPLKFIPNCYVIMYQIHASSPAE